MKIIKLLIIIICFASNSTAQTTPAKPSTIELTSADHGLAKEIEILHQQITTEEGLNSTKLFTKNYLERLINPINTNSILPDTSCIVTIPIVFHVFHPQGSAGVPMSQINYAVNDLNLTFAGTDADYTTVNPIFAGVKSYTKIRFARALIDPKGNPTTGVVYYQDKQSGFGNGSGWDNEIISCAWENHKYFNVYIMNDLYANNTTNNSGVCWYPSTFMSNNGTARMVYNYVYFGQGGSSYNYLEFNQTFTHECGHYLNLYHTFEGNSCTGNGDYCADTPPADNAGAGCLVTACTGPINGENYMDYNTSCMKNFTMEQNDRMEAALLTPSRQSLWQYDNLVATGILNPLSTNSCVVLNDFFAYTKTDLIEAIANNGTIEMPPISIYACGSTQFSISGGNLVAGVHYNITNVPAGLSVSIVTASNGKSATMNFSGQATNHSSSNSVNNILLTFTNASIIGGNVSAVQNNTKNFRISFKNPWQQICETLTITTTPTSTWNSFETAGPVPRFYGLWYNANTFYLENYGRGIITTGISSDNIQFLTTGTAIGAASTWRIGGGQGVLYSSTYTSLNNQTGYVGFRMQIGNDFFYGWMKISVSSTNGITLLEYQYNEKPNETILAGSICNSSIGIDENFSNMHLTLYPNPANDYFTFQNPNEIFSDAELCLLTLEGKIVHTEKITAANQKIDIRFLANGIYIVSLRYKSEKLEYYGKLSKN